MTMIEHVQCVWHRSGTKILGFGTALIGLLEFIDQNTIQLVSSGLGPKWGPITAHGIQIVTGIMVARRGFINSRHSG